MCDTSILMFDDRMVANEIRRIENVIENWIKHRGLWGDCCFRTYLDSCDAEPWKDHPVVTIFMSEGEFIRGFDENGELYEEFRLMLERHGYWFELDPCTLYILSLDPEWNERFKEYFRWQWICSLIKPDFNDIHPEVFAHFSQKPEHFDRLKWRDFEILIYELLRHQGFAVELGPGQGDGGVDMKLFVRDPIGDILTAVQIKRYRSDRKIKLEAVMALHGAQCAYGMNRSMFVTSSDYLPSAERFAARNNVSMDLFASNDVVTWCEQANRGIIEDKNRLVSEDGLKEAFRLARNNPEQYILHSITGYTMKMNEFAIKLKETNHAALLMRIPSKIVSHDGYKTRGFELPDVNSTPDRTQHLAPIQRGIGEVFRAKRKKSDYGISFWTGSNHFSAWDGKKQYFDHLD